jgi:hypothetical protein
MCVPKRCNRSFELGTCHLEVLEIGYYLRDLRKGRRLHQVNAVAAADVIRNNGVE